MRRAAISPAFAFLLLAALAPAPLASQDDGKGVDSGGETRPASRAESKPRKEWLRQHQSPDGRWSSDGFSANCLPEFPPACSGPGIPNLDIGVTGLALVAFHRAGFDSQRPGPYRDTIRGGLDFLARNQDVSGGFGAPTAPHFAWSHACATVAMCEAYSSSKTQRWGKSARAAIELINKANAAIWPWDSTANATDEGIFSAAWALHALSCNAEYGAETRSDATCRALAFLDRVVDRDEQRRTATSRGSPDSASSRPSLIAVTCALAAACDWRQDNLSLVRGPERERMLASQKLLLDRFPSLTAEAGSSDLQGYYFATRTTFGGPDWDERREAIQKAVLGRQVKTGCAEGSFDPTDAWGKAVGGRVYSTAVTTLTLIFSYRYPKVFRGPPEGAASRR